MAGWRKSFAPFLSWILFVRLTLLVALLFVAFPFLATGPARSLLGGTFVLGFWGLASVTLLALAVSRALILVVDTASRSGPIRLLPRLVSGTMLEARSFTEQKSVGVALSWNPEGAAAQALRGWKEWIGVALSVPTILVGFTESCEPPPGFAGPWGLWKLAAIVIGLAAYVAIRVLADLLERRLAPPELEEGVPERGPLKKLRQKSARHEPGRWALALRRLVIRFFRLPTFGVGYVRERTDRELDAEVARRERSGTPRPAGDAPEDPTLGFELLPGHASALSFFGLTFVVYALLGLFNHPSWFTAWAPTLAYVLLIFMMASWVLHALSFWLDRFRVPVLVLIVLASVLSFSIGGGDHYFRLLDPPAAATRTEAPAADTEPQTDEELFYSRIAKSCAQPVVVVAAAGGGITSAAWTTAVLTRLAENPDSGGALLDSLRLVSGVSGGSVGSMFFVDGLPAPAIGRGQDPLPHARGAAIRRAASASSLETVGWGLAYPDLFRVLLSPAVNALSPWVDRSWALEQSWNGRLVSAGEGGGGDAEPPTLRAWRDDFRSGARPAVIFNATAVETGERFQLATIRAASATAGVVRFWSAYPGYDVSVPTAARLSATFPFVSTAARARSCCGTIQPEAHYVDGGYYDNSGLLSVLEVLDRTLARLHASTACRPPIAILQLEAFDPEAKSVAQVEAGSGWTTSATSPIATLVAVRTSTQTYRNSWELGVFADKWRNAGFEIGPVPIRLGGLGPLSWRLTAREIDRIERVAEDAMSSEPVVKLQRMLGGERRLFARPEGMEETVVEPLTQPAPTGEPPAGGEPAP